MQILIFRPQNSHVNAANADEFQRQLLAAVSSPEVSILLVDLSEVEYIDSAGLMAFVSALNLAKSLDRHLSICSVAPAVRMVFELTQLDLAFEIFENDRAFATAMA
ncbi:MAG: STAS domain-containing protein [Cyanosarcina radialis HA8281-LM2]|nr:STAS domain-containing protein [Cyanosarcina radialis HA8281-LM2]